MPLNDSNFHNRLISIRRNFHRHPELSHQETRTTDQGLWKNCRAR